MELTNSPVFYIVMALVTSFVITLIAIPSIIEVAKKKHLYDEPGARKAHSSNIPTLGGVAIFGGFIISLAMWSDMSQLKLLQYVLAACCVIFLVGAKDDIVELNPRKKFIGQIIATAILVILGGLYFKSFHDLFPTNWEIPHFLVLIISGFTMLVIINSFNLIDGINALSGSQGIIISSAFGYWFWFAGDYQMVILVASLVGAILAFLKYNVSPASIFMGDTGSLLIGLICAVMAIRFINMNIDETLPNHVNAAPAVAIGFMAFPLFDLLRAFSIRIAKGRSPFHPDRNHLHHMILDCGFSHMKATYILGAIQIFYILAVYQLQKLDLNSWVIFGILLVVSVSISTFLHKQKKKYRAKKRATIQ